MKLKKSVKRFLIVFLILLVAGVGVFVYIKFAPSKSKVKKVKIVDEIGKYGYQLKDSKNDLYKNEFKELKKILNSSDVNYEEYAKAISKLFIADFYSLDDKLAKTDVGGVEFVYKDEQADFLEKAENTLYKYVESNVYGNREQNLPAVDSVNVEKIEPTTFKINASGKQDDNAYEITVTWKYKNESGSGYQDSATLIVVHEDDIKLSIAEME